MTFFHANEIVSVIIQTKGNKLFNVCRGSLFLKCIVLYTQILYLDIADTLQIIGRIARALSQDPTHIYFVEITWCVCDRNFSMHFC